MSRSSALETEFAANRAKLLRFLVARGAGDAAEDLVQELWLKLSRTGDPAAAASLGYMMRAADRLMIDRFRSARQAVLRDTSWAASQPGFAERTSAEPCADRVIESRQHARLVAAALNAISPRAAAVFRRHRIDNVSQREIADEFAISLSTVESDMRIAGRAILEVRRQIDEG
ncbi:sigma-70 family RNA polymerase sigma factor [Erythrobacter sp. 3-20A1M]|uniref:RNA polymerase sigma factor n=1 Tax=Erythrobacter sp. 3-20A1M TaxID=2653850 RepID=UPI001BFC1AC0|nr:RNA polymerase sigma factor [Erythrobacter sp. 3-20A1M]QWC57314.1 sigma-70 family RNA polymerase sigma factor [Erythrobacter sp. 3-20A1M]